MEAWNPMRGGQVYIFQEIYSQRESFLNVLFVVQTTIMKNFFLLLMKIVTYWEKSQAILFPIFGDKQWIQFT